MYYLVVRNLGAPRCIDHNEKDIYEDGMSFDCTSDLECSPGEFVKEVEIRCIEHPEERFVAMVFKS